MIAGVAAERYCMLMWEPPQSLPQEAGVASLEGGGGPRAVATRGHLPDLPPPPPQEGQQLIEEKPELGESVRRKLGEIRQCWAELEATTQVKAQQLLEATKADRLAQSYADLDKRLLRMEGQLQAVDTGPDLVSVNSSLQKLQVGLLPGLAGSAHFVPRLPPGQSPCKEGAGHGTPWQGGQGESEPPGQDRGGRLVPHMVFWVRGLHGMPGTKHFTLRVGPGLGEPLLGPEPSSACGEAVLAFALLRLFAGWREIKHILVWQEKAGWRPPPLDTGISCKHFLHGEAPHLHRQMDGRTHKHPEVAQVCPLSRHGVLGEGQRGRTGLVTPPPPSQPLAFAPPVVRAKWGWGALLLELGGGLNNQEVGWEERGTRPPVQGAPAHL